MAYGLHDIVQMKKDHPCRKSQHWEIVRMGVDIKIKCLGCGNIIMMERPDFERKLKKIIEKAVQENTEE
jgi:Uncharacterized protein conserved in bacteria